MRVDCADAGDIVGAVEEDRAMRRQVERAGRHHAAALRDRPPARKRDDAGEDVAAQRQIPIPRHSDIERAGAERDVAQAEGAAAIDGGGAAVAGEVQPARGDLAVGVECRERAAAEIEGHAVDVGVDAAGGDLEAVMVGQRYVAGHGVEASGC